MGKKPDRHKEDAHFSKKRNVRDRNVGKTSHKRKEIDDFIDGLGKSFESLFGEVVQRTD